MKGRQEHAQDASTEKLTVVAPMSTSSVGSMSESTSSVAPMSTSSVTSTPEPTSSAIPTPTLGAQSLARRKSLKDVLDEQKLPDDKLDVLRTLSEEESNQLGEHEPEKWDELAGRFVTLKTIRKATQKHVPPVDPNDRRFHASPTAQNQGFFWLPLHMQDTKVAPLVGKKVAQAGFIFYTLEKKEDTDFVAVEHLCRNGIDKMKEVSLSTLENTDYAYIISQTGGKLEFRFGSLNHVVIALGAQHVIAGGTLTLENGIITIANNQTGGYYQKNPALVDETTRLAKQAFIEIGLYKEDGTGLVRKLSFYEQPKEDTAQLDLMASDSTSSTPSVTPKHNTDTSSHTAITTSLTKLTLITATSPTDEIRIITTTSPSTHSSMSISSSPSSGSSMSTSSTPVVTGERELTSPFTPHSTQSMFSPRERRACVTQEASSAAKEASANSIRRRRSLLAKIAL